MTTSTEYQESFAKAVELLLTIDKKRCKKLHNSEDYAKCVSDLDILLTRTETAYGLTFLEAVYHEASRRNNNCMRLDESVCSRMTKLAGPIGNVHRMAAMHDFYSRHL